MAAANEDTYVTSWAEGQGSERLDRRLAKRKDRKPKKTAGQAKCDGPTAAAPEPRMVLLHGDVLELPVPPTMGGTSLEQPDIVASLNYAMAYFHDRSTLIRYLRSVAQSLRPKTGVFITDMFGGPPTGEAYEDQDELWTRFWDEPGFLRTAGDAAQFQLPTRAPDTDDDDLVVRPAPSDTERGTRAEWPRGKLKMVRTGTAHGGFEYWREDGPIDYTTNRFRMSLSFRFADHSWLRDVFSYDFRIWSLKEVRFSAEKPAESCALLQFTLFTDALSRTYQLTEAMEEAGFAFVRVLVLPRNDIDQQDVSDTDSDISDEIATMFLRTEKEEAQRRRFHTVQPGEKVFSTRSFATYIVGRVM